MTSNSLPNVESLPTHLDLEEKRDKRIRSDFHWARVKDSRAGSINSHPTGASERSDGKGTRKPDIGLHDAQVPVIRSTLYDIEDHKGPNGDDLACQDASSTSSVILSSARQEERRDIIRPVLPLKARHFHLVKNSFLSPSHVIAGHGIRKPKNKEKSIALFTERRVLQMLQLEDASKMKANMDQPVETLSIQHQDLVSPDLVTPEPRMYKRPNATAEEVKWRAKTWQSPAKTEKDSMPISEAPEGTEGDYSSYGDYSLELAMQLQEFAIPETQNSAAHKPPMERKSQLKYQPKLPGPKPKKPVIPVQEIQKDTKMLNTHAGENDEDYIYDTYVRSDGPIRNAAGLHDLSSNTDQKEFGLLVIEEDDEEAWEEFGEDAESDKEWDTDDEDENGSSNLLVKVKT